jgi:hypothetical protein
VAHRHFCAVTRFVLRAIAHSGSRAVPHGEARVEAHSEFHSEFHSELSMVLVDIHGAARRVLHAEAHRGPHHDARIHARGRDRSVW